MLIFILLILFTFCSQNSAMLTNPSKIEIQKQLNYYKSLIATLQHHYTSTEVVEFYISQRNFYEEKLKQFSRKRKRED